MRLPRDKNIDGGNDEAFVMLKPALFFSFALVIAFFCFITWRYLYLIPVNHDVAWFLFLTEKMMDGAVLYRDYIDPSPPFIFIFQAPAVWIAHFFNLSSITCFYLYTSFWIAASVLTCRHLVRLSMPELKESRLNVLLLLMVFLMCILPLGNFGQREHLMLILVFPYILLIAARAQGKTVHALFALAIGIVAGIGITFKPYFLCLWGMCEAYAWFFCPDVGVKRPENLGLACVTAVSWLYLPFSGYTRLIPFLIDMYAPLSISFTSLFISWPTAIWFFLLPVLFFGRKLKKNTGQTLFILFMAATAFLIQTLIQRKNWFYQNFPLWACAGFIFGLVLLLPMSCNIGTDKKRKVFSAISLSVFFVLLGYGLFRFGPARTVKELRDPYAQRIRVLSAAVHKLAYRRPICMLTTNITLPFPIVNYSGADWHIRYHCLWPLWTFYGKKWYPDHRIVYRKLSEMDINERTIFEQIINDIIASPPALIGVDISGQPIYRGQIFPFIDYFNQDNRFAAFFKTYKYMKNIEGIDMYQRRGL